MTNDDLCCWKEDSNGAWWTDCGNGFELMDGSPLDNGMKFCCYCGKRLCEHGCFEEVEK